MKEVTEMRQVGSEINRSYANLTPPRRAGYTRGGAGGQDRGCLTAGGIEDQVDNPGRTSQMSRWVREARLSKHTPDSLRRKFKTRQH